jgi:hypothetical protein
MHIVAKSWDMQHENCGLIFGAIGFSFPFIRYNMKIAQEDSDVEFL